MPINLVIAKSYEELQDSRSGAGISEPVHTEVWSDPSGTSLPAPRGRGGIAIGHFPLLFRLSDPYRDAAFFRQELPQLLVELQRVLACEALSRTASNEFRVFAELVQRAAAVGANVYALGD